MAGILSARPDSVLERGSIRRRFPLQKPGSACYDRLQGLPQELWPRLSPGFGMNILIAGCGYVGTALGVRLGADGHSVWGLRRRPDGLPDIVRPLAGDLSDAATLQDLPPGLDVVYYTAGAADSSEAAYRTAYVDGPRHLLEALQQQGQRPRRVVFTSSTGVYAQCRGEWVDEDSPRGTAARRRAASAGGGAALSGRRLSCHRAATGRHLWAGPHAPDRQPAAGQRHVSRQPGGLSQSHSS